MILSLGLSLLAGYLDFNLIALGAAVYFLWHLVDRMKGAASELPTPRL